MRQGPNQNIPQGEIHVRRLDNLGFYGCSDPCCGLFPYQDVQSSEAPLPRRPISKELLDYLDTDFPDISPSDPNALCGITYDRSLQGFRRFTNQEWFERTKLISSKRLP